MTRYFYLFFTVMIPIYVSAQSPGGVRSPEVWLQTVPDKHEVSSQYHWFDVSGDSVFLNKISQSVLSRFEQNRSDVRSFNFHPAISIVPDAYEKVFHTSVADFTRATFLGVFARKLTRSRDNFLMQHDLEGTNGERLYTDEVVSEDGNLQYKEELTARNAVDNLKILTYMRSGMPNHSVWNRRNGSSVSFSSARRPANAVPTWSIMPPNRFVKSNGFYLPELIVYDRVLSPWERRKVETYLALKYGITLKDSYFSPEGNLMWDRKENENYHHRVTGVMRNDLSLLNQRVSTTSYEEAPNYSIVHDSYYQGNDNGDPSDKRLLVVGRGMGSELHDNAYAIWGDNGGSLSFYDLPDNPDVHLLNRKWLMRTNITESRKEVSVMSGIQLERIGNSGFYHLGAGFTFSGSFRGSIKNNRSLLRFKSKNPQNAFTLLYKTQNGKQVGYKFERGIVTPVSGEMNTYVRGLRIPSEIWLLQDEKGVSLQSPYGHELLHTNVSRPNVFTTLEMSTTNMVTTLDSVSFDGFHKTGFTVELSYDRLPILRQLKSAQVPLLIISESDNGSFSSKNLRMIEPEQIDTIRKKLIFKNVYFDQNQNGKCYFTFGYGDRFIYRSTSTAASDLNGRDNPDGSVELQILKGRPIYVYELKAKDVPAAFLPADSVVSRSYFEEDSYTIDNLYPGTYELSMWSLTPRYITGFPQRPGRYSLIELSAPFSVPVSSVSWTHETETGSYVLMSSNSSSFPFFNDFTAPTYSPDFILQMRNSFMVPGNRVLKKGDKIKVVSESGELVYYVNGSVVNRSPLKHQFSGSNINIYFNNGVSSLRDLRISDYPPFIKNRVGTVQIDRYTDIHRSSEVVVGRRSLENHAKQMDTDSEADNVETSDGQLHVTHLSGGTYLLRATLDLSPAQASDLLVFDMSGNLVHSESFAHTDRIATDFSVPMPGVYIVKAVTADHEYTCKILVK